MKRILSFALCFCCILSVLLIPMSAIEPIGTIKGETSRTVEEITLPDGRKTGVKYTNIKLSGYYGNNREVNIAEGELSNTNLSLKIINSGTYMVSMQNMKNAASSYNANHEGQKVLAAVNGDLYMTSIHSGSSVTKKVLSVPRGILIVDGEIWASAQVDQENLGATNEEKGDPAGIRPAFGVTDLNQPVVGMPVITTTLNIDGKVVKTDGINRIPAMDSIMVYNNRVNFTNYALNDSYEVEIRMHGSSAFVAGGEITGTIVKIYEPGSTARPSLENEKTVVLTARGSRINELKSICSTGKRVTLSTELVDLYGKTEMWQNVQDAIGGHMQVLQDDIGAPIPQEVYYPTTLIGYKDDGTVALVTVTSTKDKSRAALKISQSYELCRELGYNSVFYLDGGGSTTFVTLEEGSYTIRNKCSDGSARSVIGGIGFVWNDEPLCMRQGNLNHIKVTADLSAISPVYMDGALLEEIVNYPIGVDIGYNSGEKAFEMKVNKATNDPFATLDFTKLQRVKAEDYPYIVLRVKSSKIGLSKFSFYYACGNDNGASANRLKTFNVKSGAKWQYIIVNMGYCNGWNGNINNIRLDIFESEASNIGDTMYISSIALCKNEEEANKAASGWIPDNACKDYASLIENLKPTPYFVAGDVTGDGAINFMDSFKTKTFIKNIDVPTREESYASDVNGDGVINLIDTFELKYRIAKGKWRY